MLPAARWTLPPAAAAAAAGDVRGVAGEIGGVGKDDEASLDSSVEERVGGGAGGGCLSSISGGGDERGEMSFEVGGLGAVRFFWGRCCCGVGATRLGEGRSQTGAVASSSTFTCAVDEREVGEGTSHPEISSAGESIRERVETASTTAAVMVGET